MKLTKTKLHKLIREALTEDWRDEVADQERERSARAAMIQAVPHQSRAGSELQLKWAAEEEERRASGLVLDADEYELIQAALSFGRQLASKGLDTPTGRGDVAIERLKKIEETLANHWEQAESDKSAIPIPSDHLKIIHRLMSYEQPLSAFNFSRYLDDAWQGYLKDKLPAIKDRIKSAIAGNDEPEEKEEQTVQDRWRDQLDTDREQGEELDPEPSQRFANLELSEALRRYKEGQTMKLTKTKLHQLIREELNKIKEADSPWGPPYVEPHPRDAVPIKDPVEVEPEKIPIEDITFDQLRGKQVTVAASGGLGGDSSVLMSSEPRFEEWKSTVLRDYPGSTIIFNRWGRWSPGSGPWKDAAVKKQNFKAKELARYGSH